MKQFKTLVALVLALALTLTLVGAAMAEGHTLTINRDSTWSTNGTGTGTVYTYTKILSAVITGNLPTVNQATGEWSGTAGNVVYYVTDADQAAALGTTGVFTVAAVASDGNYYVTSTETDGAVIAAAIDTMLTTYPSAFTSTQVTSGGETTTISNLSDGYYFIKASNGSKLAVQTLGDVTINEKNTYPTITKEEMDPEVANAIYGKTAPVIGVGDTVNYKVTVTVPADANQDTIVTDTMSTGLSYNASSMAIAVEGKTLTAGTDYVVGTPGVDETWKYIIKPTENMKGNTVVFTFTATVTKDAIVNEKENEVELDYDNYHVEDSVPYKMYKSAAFKYDGADHNALANVVFTLKENGSNFLVSKDATGGYYYPDTNGSADVTTDATGMIYIRGLDNEKTYTLIEKSNPNPGYNMVAGTTTLTLVEDTATDSTAWTISDPYSSTVDELSTSKIANNKGSELPSTGGIGTTIFYVAGIVLVLGAAAIIIARRKAEQN